MSEEFISPAEAAAFLGVSTVTVQLQCREGKIPAIKVGSRWRIPKDAIVATESPPDEKQIDESVAQSIANGVHDALMAGVSVTVSYGG